MYSLEEIIAMSNKSHEDYLRKQTSPHSPTGKSKIDTFIEALSPEDLQVTMDKVLIRQFQEADKKARENPPKRPGFVPTYDEIRNWYGYGKTKAEGKVFIAVEAQEKLYRYLMETCPHCLGDFRDSDRVCTMYARHACGECMEEIGMVF